MSLPLFALIGGVALYVFGVPSLPMTPGGADMAAPSPIQPAAPTPAPEETPPPASAAPIAARAPDPTDHSTDAGSAPELARDDEAPAARAPEAQVATGKYLTALEVKPILGAMQGSWIALSEANGQDALYFTGLLAWRCGLWEIRYGLNGAPAETVLPMEPCHIGTTAPAAMTDVEGFPVYLTFPGGAVRSVTVAIDYDDGTSQSADFLREGILMP